MNVAILGLGLMGGSIGLAARAREGAQAARVVGYDPDPDALALAQARGAVDEPAGEPAAAVAGADVAFVATPVGALAQTARIALEAAPAGCVVTDVGSTKRALLRQLQGAPGAERFIGGHPLAGSEQGGVEHARPDLFEGAAWCLTPAPRTQGRQRLAELIASFGANVVEIDADSHDALMARVSHLPHLLANVLVAGTSGLGERERSLAAAGPSFRDATRVAGASTAIWTEIYLSNADMLAGAIDEAIAELEQVRDLLAREDAEALSSWNEHARALKQALAPPCP